MINPGCLGPNIKAYREARGWSMRDLGRAAGVSASMICRAESAVDWNITLAGLTRIANALGVGVADLFDEVHHERVICPTCHGIGWVVNHE